MATDDVGRGWEWLLNASTQRAGWNKRTLRWVGFSIVLTIVLIWVSTFGLDGLSGLTHAGKSECEKLWNTNRHNVIQYPGAKRQYIENCEESRTDDLREAP